MKKILYLIIIFITFNNLYSDDEKRLDEIIDNVKNKAKVSNQVSLTEQKNLEEKIYFEKSYKNYYYDLKNNYLFLPIMLNTCFLFGIGSWMQGDYTGGLIISGLDFVGVTCFTIALIDLSFSFSPDFPALVLLGSSIVIFQASRIIALYRVFSYFEEKYKLYVHDDKINNKICKGNIIEIPILIKDF